MSSRARVAELAQRSDSAGDCAGDVEESETIIDCQLWQCQLASAQEVHKESVTSDSNTERENVTKFRRARREQPASGQHDASDVHSIALFLTNVVSMVGWGESTMGQTN